MRSVCDSVIIINYLLYLFLDGHLPWPTVPHPQGPQTPAPPPPHFVQQASFRMPVGPPPSYPGSTGGKYSVCQIMQYKLSFIHSHRSFSSSAS